VAPVKRELTNDEVLNVKQRARESLQFWKSEEEKRVKNAKANKNSSSSSSSSHTTSHASNSTSAAVPAVLVGGGGGSTDYHSRHLSSTTNTTSSTTTSYSAANSRGGRVITGGAPNTGAASMAAYATNVVDGLPIHLKHNNRRVKDTISAFENKFQHVETNGGRDSTSVSVSSSSSSSSSSTSTSSSCSSSQQPQQQQQPHHVSKNVFKADPIRHIKRIDNNGVEQK
jgi:hypothetical protein